MAAAVPNPHVWRRAAPEEGRRAGHGLCGPRCAIPNLFGLRLPRLSLPVTTRHACGVPRLRVDAGCIASPEGKEAGEYIEIQVVSYAPSWTITTGTDGEESKKWVRFSDDGKVTNPAGDNDEFAGMPVDEYKAHLVAQGFEKASIKAYTIIYGIAVEAEEQDFAHLNEMIALSLAPQSAKKFDSYIINRTIQAKMRRIEETSGNPVVRFTSERTKGKDNQSYFNLIPSHGKTAPVDLS